MSVKLKNAKLFFEIGKISQKASLEGLGGSTLMGIISIKAFNISKISILGYRDVHKLLAELNVMVFVALFKKASGVFDHLELSPDRLSVFLPLDRLFVFRDETNKLKEIVEPMKDPGNDLDAAVSFSALRSVLSMVGLFDPKVFSADLAVMTLKEIATHLMSVDVSKYGS